MNIRSLLFCLFLLCAPGLLLADAPVNINDADAETLALALQGVGPQRAEAIVSYRQAHGPFLQVDDLVQVRGIGSATLEANRERLALE